MKCSMCNKEMVSGIVTAENRPISFLADEDRHGLKALINSVVISRDNAFAAHCPAYYCRECNIVIISKEN